MWLTECRAAFILSSRIYLGSHLAERDKDPTHKPDPVSTGVGRWIMSKQNDCYRWTWKEIAIYSVYGRFR